MDTKKIGRFIAERRKAKKLTQKELAEESIATTLEYSRKKIKKSRIKVFLTLAGCVCGILFIWFLLNAVFFAEVPYQSGDVSRWEEQYPNHSAFEMGLSRTGQPVFVDTAKAMRQAKVIYSDAISFLQKEYHLLPLTQYTYKSYMVYGWQIVCEDDAIKEQGRDLTGFLDIYDNCFEWKKLAMTREGKTRNEGDCFV